MRKRRSTFNRVLTLAATLMIGVLAGSVGYLFTESQTWFLAVPASLAAMWLYIADPSRCLPVAKEGEPSHHRDSGAA